ncbi:MAG: ABC transporter permease [Bacilli bacterium]|nr:ABC transporter permease [Bacilli bacterium]
MDFVNILFNILTSGLPCCLLAIGVFLTFRILDFADMTAEGSFLLGAALTASLIYNHINPFLATFLGMIVGAGCGLVTGFLNRILKIPKLLSGIITLTASASIAMLIMGITTPGQIFYSQVPLSLSSHQTIYSVFYSSKISASLAPFPWNKLVESLVMIVIVGIMIVTVYYFFGTEFGMAIRATGMNEKMAKSQGINTNISSIACVAISNALIGLAGALYVQDALSVSTVSATGYLVIGLASILIGEAIFGKRSFKNWLLSVSGGALLYFVIITIAIKLGLPTELMSLLYAILITIALCIPLFKLGINKLKTKLERGKEHVRT